jgi:hypothetical protein
VITCGAFSAMPLTDGGYRFSCDYMPGWHVDVACTRAEALRAVIDLQAKHRADQGAKL